MAPYESQLLLNFRQNIIDNCPFPPERVIITAEQYDPTDLERGDNYCLLCYGSDQADMGIAKGAGRTTSPYASGLMIEANLLITIYNRLSLDSLPENSQFLLDNAFGMFSLINSVRDACQMYYPLLSLGEGVPPLQMLVSPLRYKGRNMIKMLDKPGGWGMCSMGFIFNYSPPMLDNIPTS